MKTLNSMVSILAMLSVLIMTSCTQDELVNESALGDYVTASFNLTTADGLGTRAIGDGTTVDKVVCGVFDSKGVEMTNLRETLDIVGKQAKYSIRLAKGQNYRVAFFAYNEEANAYDVTNLKAITLKDGQLSNVEGRDAFTAYFNIEEGVTMQPIVQDITLYRPFAQLNLGSHMDDWDAAVDAGVTVSTTKVIVSNVYTTFSAYDDAVVGHASERTFNLNTIPGETLKADADGDGQVEEYKYLAMNYLLVGDKQNEKSLTDVTFVWETKDGKTNKPETEFTNIPVQRNFRTNIIGWLLTNPAEFNITIDENFEEPDYNIVNVGGTSASPEGLESAMEDINKNGIKDAKIKIPAGSYASWTTGAAHGSTPWVNANNSSTETVTIQGEGENSVLIVDGDGVGSLRAANGAKLIFKDITIVDNTESYNEGAWELTYLEFAGNLEFKNVRFEGGIALQGENDDSNLNATFTNCTFITEEESVYAVWVSDGTSSFSNCKFQGTRGLKMHEAYGSEIAEVMIDACEFGPLSKKPGVAIGDLNAETKVTIQNSSFIGCQAGDQGMYIYESDTDVSTFTFAQSNNSVEEDPANVVKIGNKEELIALQRAVNVDINGYSGKTIKLTADIDLEGMDWEPIGQTGGNGVTTYFQGTFDGQEHTIRNFTVKANATYGKGANYATGLFGFIDGSKAVIKNLNVDQVNVYGHHWSGVIAGYLTGTIQNCHVTNSNVYCTHANNDACGDKAGMIVGYINSGSVEDCTATKGSVTAGRDAGQIVGASKQEYIIDCSAENVSVSATGDCNGANIRNELIGRVL